MANLSRIVYVSTAVADFGREELASLAEAAARRNLAEGITGVLCYKGGAFLQVIEGPDERIRELWARLSADDRHTWLQCLVDERIEDRLFEAWNMGLCDLDSGDCAARAEFRAIASFLKSCRGIDGNAVVMGLIRHFRSLTGERWSSGAA